MALIPTQVSFRHLDHSDALEADIRERVVGLEQYNPGIVGCRVLVDVPHRHRQSGRQFHVRIEATIPGGAPIVVNHTPSLHKPLKQSEEESHRKESEVEADRRYALVAVREAFEIARRQLQDAAREQRHQVKTHQAPAS